MIPLNTDLMKKVPANKQGSKQSLEAMLITHGESCSINVKMGECNCKPLPRQNGGIQILPTILKRWPHGNKYSIDIQQDNACPHIVHLENHRVNIWPTLPNCE